MLDLGALPGDSQSYGTGINANGDVCGISKGSGSHAFVWNEDGGMRALAPLPTGVDTWAYGINASGQVAGMSSYVGPGGNRCYGAVVWDASDSIHLIPVLDRTLSGAMAAATAINDAGQATGFQGVRDLGFTRSQPFVWDATNGLKLLARSAGTSARPLANNSAGQVLGLSATDKAFPVSWASNGKGTRLDNANTLSNAGPFKQELGGINSAGEIVYSVSAKNGGAATLYRAGTAVDLNALVDPGAAVHLSTASAINDNGQIVGGLMNSDGTRSHAYLLTPRKAANSALVVPGLTPVNLRTAGNFAILSSAGISTTGVTQIVGNIGTSPTASTAITGFGLTMDSSGKFSRSTLVTGQVFAADYAAPTPTMLTTAVSDMGTAYNDAAGRTNPTATELGAGNIGGMVLGPGLYKWSSSVLIPTDLTLSGPSTGVWIFQIAGSLNVSSGTHVNLSGGAQASNIFWQVADRTTLETTSVFNGNILDQTAIEIKTGATLNGRALAQTAVSLDANAVTRPLAVPAAPISLVATGVSATQVKLVWQDCSNNETSFKVERSVNGAAFALVGATAANAVTFNNTGLSLANTTYTYRVRAYNSDGYSAYTNEAVVPITPANLTVTVPAAPGGSTQLNLVWTNSSANEAGFKVERSVDGTTYVVVGATAPNGVAFNNTGLTPNTLYYYRVRAYTKSGTGVTGYSWYSPTRSAQTLP
jgi:hypothetical protein